jgi:hypothetical protein
MTLCGNTGKIAGTESSRYSAIGGAVEAPISPNDELSLADILLQKTAKAARRLVVTYSGGSTSQ